MNIQDVINFCQVYNEIADKPMPIKLSYRLMKAHKDFADSFEFYQKEFSNILQTYAIRNEKGEISQTKDGNIPMQTDKADEWQAKFKTLNELEVEAPEPCIYLDEIEGLKLTPRQVEAIGFLIK